MHATALLTHLHFDHILGIPFFGPLHDPGRAPDRVRPAQPKGSLKDALSGRAAARVPHPHGAVPGRAHHHRRRLRDLSIGSAKIMARPIPHAGVTLGFRIEAEGRSIAYMSTPGAARPARHPRGRARAVSRRRPVIHDGQYTDDEFSAKADWGHSTAAYAVHVAAEAGAKRLCSRTTTRRTPTGSSTAFSTRPAGSPRPSSSRTCRRRTRPSRSTSARRKRRASHMSGLDQARFREVLGHFATGVTIVTALEDGMPVGFQCQSFAALSLDPPMVILPRPQLDELAPYRQGGRLLVNISGSTRRRSAVPSPSRAATSSRASAGRTASPGRPSSTTRWRWSSAVWATSSTAATTSSSPVTWWPWTSARAARCCSTGMASAVTTRYRRHARLIPSKVIEDVVLVRPDVHGDERGRFVERTGAVGSPTGPR